MQTKANKPVAEAHDELEGIFYLLDHMCKTFERIDQNLSDISYELSDIKDCMRESQ